jgi:UDP-N-acetyl-D-mannosaminuronate dehydrogenase
MSITQSVVVVGLGEVGKPLAEILAAHHEVLGVDLAPTPSSPKAVDVLHICFPFQVQDFIGETARYIERFRPKLTVINSTVAVGTTRAIALHTGAAVAFSPVRGKHARMREEMRSYTKFVGALKPESADQAAKHFQSVGLKTRILSSPESAELAKLTETTYFGLLIAWAQEVERYACQTGQDYGEIIAFYEEIEFFPPVKYFPGVIGGHCIMPNLEILRQLADTDLLNAIRSSNKEKAERDQLKSL